MGIAPSPAENTNTDGKNYNSVHWGRGNSSYMKYKNIVELM